MLQLLKRKTEQQIVAEIHNEFDTAEDRLLEQANKLLSELNLETEESMNSKAKRLSSLGFINSEPVKWVNDNSLIKTRQQAELIKHYKQTYPFQKFLTEVELERICKKYNLVFAPVENYIKDVPEKNLCEIEKAPILHSQDNPNDFYLFKYKGKSDLSLDEKLIASNGVMLSKLQWCGTHDNSGNLSAYFGRRVKCEYETLYNTSLLISRNGLFICAPKSHFDLSGLTKLSVGFMSALKIEPKDPIVFRYVRGGVQVLSKWGLEGQDESLVNEKMN